MDLNINKITQPKVCCRTRQDEEEEEEVKKNCSLLCKNEMTILFSY